MNNDKGYCHFCQHNDSCGMCCITGEAKRMALGIVQLDNYLRSTIEDYDLKDFDDLKMLIAKFRKHEGLEL